MNAVGIDISKGKSMVAILRPYGEIVASPFEVKHTASNLNSLVDLIKSVDGKSRIVMEHTGRYYEPILALQFQTILQQKEIIYTHCGDSIFIMFYLNNIFHYNNLLKRIIHIKQ